MLIPVLLFILGLLFLIKGGDWFVDSAVAIAHRFHISELLIGASVVSVGTTLPEVMVSATSALSGHGEIAYGNAVGSIICNTALIAAISIVASPGKVNKKALRTPVFFFFAAAAYYCFVSYTYGALSRVSGMILFGLFCVYIVFTIFQMKKNDESMQVAVFEKNVHSLTKDILFLVIGAILIAFGAKLLVDNGTLIAQALHVPESVIALTFVALGTSLPELVTAISSLVKGHGSLSLGNIIGANLFNLVLVNGVSAILSPFEIPQTLSIFGMNASLVIEIPVMLFVMLFMCVPALIYERLSRCQGIVLLMIYVVFCILQFIL